MGGPMHFAALGLKPAFARVRIRSVFSFAAAVYCFRHSASEPWPSGKNRGGTLLTAAAPVSLATIMRVSFQYYSTDLLYSAKTAGFATRFHAMGCKVAFGRGAVRCRVAVLFCSPSLTRFARSFRHALEGRWFAAGPITDTVPQGMWEPQYDSELDPQPEPAVSR
ncbi:hypothetical protein GGX14DRAFT_384287 [Mycena pura]|uniref:Uncharacterized protein n=1 Tax=Mycena pura TaxID=153505 RepID=A0AAD7E5P3_9AGAR|nr:hypothetical protein GGX14DRAFT_384287 [Mycena pura]